MTDFSRSTQDMRPDDGPRPPSEIPKAIRRRLTPAGQSARRTQVAKKLPLAIHPAARAQQLLQRRPGYNEGAQAGKTGPTAILPADRSAAPQNQPEIEDGNIILHRDPSFSVRTVYRPGQNPLRKPTGRTTRMPKIMPGQEKRIAASETRLMPNVAAFNPAKTSAFRIPAWIEAIVVVAGLIVVCVAHTYNMFNFPHYEIDEGTYVSSAWSIMHGQIEPYPYGYGHPPLAWIQIAAWVKLTGGFFVFGNALNSARVLMLVYALCGALLVYLIVRRFEGSRSAGLLALAITALSPLSIVYQREVFLDNAGTLWCLLSLYLIVISNSRLLYIVPAAVAFGLAILCKEVFLILFPAAIYAVWLHTTKFQRKFALIAFSYTVMALGSTYVLMAILRGEFFPYSWHLPWDTHEHLSIIDTYLSQVQRGQSEGGILEAWREWIQRDPLLISLGIAALVFNLLAGWWRRRQLLIALLAISFWLLLIRGGVVFGFYLIPLIPLIAINAAMALNTILGWIARMARFDIARALLTLGVIALIVPYNLQHVSYAFTQQPARAETQAMSWIRANIPRSAVIAISGYMYTDLRVPGGQGSGDGATYQHADVYWNMVFDPELHDGLLHNDWNRIDYIIADQPMLDDIQHAGAQMSILSEALQHSLLVTRFDEPDQVGQGGVYTVQIYQVLHRGTPPVIAAAPGHAHSTGPSVPGARNTTRQIEGEYTYAGNTT